MNKRNIEKYLRSEFNNHKSTFKKTSYDTANNIYLCEDDITEVVNFDDYIKRNYDNSNLPASPDAIYFGKKKFYFVEFKNSYNIKSSIIKSKFNSGTKVLQELLEDFKPRDVEFIFCVVYKVKKTEASYEKNIKLSRLKFGLEEENEKLDYFYNEILTEDINFFKDKEKFPYLKCA